MNSQPGAKLHHPSRPSCVACVIVTYNGAPYVTRLLKSLAAQSERPSRVILVDNASQDSTVALAEAVCPGIQIVRLDRNLGFGAANNIGIQRALDQRADAVLLLNQDLALEDADAIRSLSDALGQGSDLGMVSAIQLTYDGAEIDPTYLYCMPREFWNDIFFGRDCDVYRVPFIPAASVLIRAAALERVGGFDPLFFMYCEDEDLCRRLGGAGWNLAVAARAKVQHWHSFVNRKRSFPWRRNMEYSRAVLHLKSSPWPLPLAFVSLICRRVAHGEWGLSSWAAFGMAVLSCVTRAIAIQRSRARPSFIFRTGGALPAPSASPPPAAPQLTSGGVDV